jgi:hypothetical protein
MTLAELVLLMHERIVELEKEQQSSNAEQHERHEN